MGQRYYMLGGWCLATMRVGNAYLWFPLSWCGSRWEHAGCNTSTSHFPHGTIGHFHSSMLHTLVPSPCLLVPIISYTSMCRVALAPNISSLKVMVLSRVHLLGQVWIATFTRMRAYCKPLTKQTVGLHSGDKATGTWQACYKFIVYWVLGASTPQPPAFKSTQQK